MIKVYRELRKEVLAESFEYGEAIDQIEDQLASMESDFEEAKNLSSQGDHVEAKRVLSKIRMALGALQKKLPKIKEGHHQLEIVFQDQLKEISDAYKKMLSEKYYITDVYKRQFLYCESIFFAPLSYIYFTKILAIIRN